MICVELLCSQQVAPGTLQVGHIWSLSYTPDPAPQAIHGLTIQTLHKIKKRRLGCAEIQVRKERGGREDQPERFRMFRYVAILTSVILVSVSSATLAQDGDRSQDRRACRDDARRLCACRSEGQAQRRMPEISGKPWQMRAFLNRQQFQSSARLRLGAGEENYVIPGFGMV
jgi:hypothetical protein